MTEDYPEFVKRCQPIFIARAGNTVDDLEIKDLS